MEMQNEIITIGIICAIAIIVFLVVSSPSPEISEEQAKVFVLEELQHNHPGAEIEIVTVAPEDGSWKITSNVILEAHTPCPELMIITYNYPKFGFVPREENVVTQACEIVGCRGMASCRIGSEPEAIIASNPQARHARNGDLEGVNTYLINFGSSVTVYGEYEQLFLIENQTFQDVWVTTWDSTTANYSVTVVLNKTNGDAVGEFVS